MKPFALRNVWSPETYDAARRRLIPCFDLYYGTAAELAKTSAAKAPRVLDLGAGTGLLSEHIARAVRPKSLTLFDASPEMVEKGMQRLRAFRPRVVIGNLSDALPTGQYDVIASGLAIHHLADAEKRKLFARIYRSLAPGGVFINAEQITGPDERLSALYSQVHLDGCRRNGSSKAEISQMLERMTHDRCSALAPQVRWLRQAGFVSADTFFQWFLFAVYAGWKPTRTRTRHPLRAAAES